MIGGLNPPLVSRNGYMLMVLLINRVSDPTKQDERSCGDQEADLRRWLESQYSLPTQVKVIAGSGSGEILDRKEFVQATDEIATGVYDLVLVEDLGRIVRRMHAFIFCEDCEDAGTRLIARNDAIDTAQEDWQFHAFFAAFRHERSNKDTSKRIRRAHRNRFLQGGMVQFNIYGYLKPPGAKTDAEITKDPCAEPIYDDMFRRLEDGASFCEIADWLTASNIPLGPYSRSGKWTGPLVSNLVKRTVLKGLRRRNERMARRNNKTGRSRSVKAPLSELLERHCPHLAFIDPERYDRVLSTVNMRNARYRRRGVNGRDTRRDVPRQRTVWLGQHITCGICGRPYVYGAHGQNDHLICQGAREYRCWNSISVDGPLAATNMMEVIRSEIEQLPDYEPCLLEAVQRALQAQDSDVELERQAVARTLRTNERELENVLAAVRAAGHSSSLLEELRRLETEVASQRLQLTQFRTAIDTAIAIPSVAELREMAENAFGRLSMRSPEFGRLLHRLVPRIYVYPYRHCGGGLPRLRAKFTLSLACFLPRGNPVSSLSPMLRRELVVDLFRPPQHEFYRQQIMARVQAKQRGESYMTLRAIAAECGVKLPVVQKAIAIDAMMKRLGLSDPYLPLSEPLQDCGRWRRHRHPRFQFETLPDWERPAGHED